MEIDNLQRSIESSPLRPVLSEYKGRENLLLQQYSDRGKFFPTITPNIPEFLSQRKKYLYKEHRKQRYKSQQYFSSQSLGRYQRKPDNLIGEPYQEQVTQNQWVFNRLSNIQHFWQQDLQKWTYKKQQQILEEQLLKEQQRIVKKKIKALTPRVHRRQTSQQTFSRRIISKNQDQTVDIINIQKEVNIHPKPPEVKKPKKIRPARKFIKKVEQPEVKLDIQVKQEQPQQPQRTTKRAMSCAVGTFIREKQSSPQTPTSPKQLPIQFATHRPSLITTYDMKVDLNKSFQVTEPQKFYLTERALTRKDTGSSQIFEKQRTISVSKHTNLAAPLLEIKDFNSLDTSFSQQFKEFLDKNNCNADTKIYQYHGKGQIICQALDSLGWGYNSDLSTPFFNLHWSDTYQFVTQKHLKNWQYYNHFPNSSCLTNLYGLVELLQKVKDIRVEVNRFFPKCYDINNNESKKAFVSEYQQNQIINVIRIHAKWFEECQEKDISYGRVNIKYLNLAITNVKMILNYENPILKIKESQLNMLTKYSKIKFPVTEITQEWKERSFQSVQWIIPSEKLVKKVISLNERFYNFYPESRMEGRQNMWIIKDDALKIGNILQDFINKRYTIKPRIIQKYIEQPFLVLFKQKQCKFDMKLWVLVTSYEPLTVYLYNDFYIRVAQDQYSTDNFDINRHITNVSIQKLQYGKVKYMPSIYLMQQISEQDEFTWEENTGPKVHHIIIHTLSAAAGQMQQKPGNFELYSFSLMIDNWGDPWLLKIQSTPFLPEKPIWLQMMCSEMAKSLFEILINKIEVNAMYNGQYEYEGYQNISYEKWICLYKSSVKQSAVLYDEQGLSIKGQALDIYQEKLLEKYH